MRQSTLENRTSKSATEYQVNHLNRRALVILEHHAAMFQRLLLDQGYRAHFADRRCLLFIGVTHKMQKNAIYCCKLDRSETLWMYVNTVRFATKNKS